MSADPQDQRDRARYEARRAAFTLARDSEEHVVTRPMFRTTGGPDVRDVDPLAGAHAARDLELAARLTARDYIRQAREAGHDRDKIGHVLGMDPVGDPDLGHADAADAASTYAGPPETDALWRPRSFGWTCRSCDQHITDGGPVAGPADDEHGHAGHCPRLAKAIAEWNAGWEAEP